MDATVVCINQTKTSVNGDPTQAWFERNSRPILNDVSHRGAPRSETAAEGRRRPFSSERVPITSVGYYSIELSRLRDWMCLLGAITEDDESVFSRFPEYVTAEPAKNIIISLYNEYEYDLIIVLASASNFRASTVTGLASRDGLEFVQLPAIDRI